MRLALNTFVYEVGKVPIEKALQSAARLGFTFVEYAAYDSGDPTSMDKTRRDEVLKLFKDNGLECSQMLLANCENIASPDPTKREAVMEYMKRCADFQLELGGKQVLVCWGCGVLESGVMPEESWLNTVSSIREYAEWSLDKGILIDLELDPHVYFVVNNTVRMAKVIEDVGMPNVFPNVDIGHLCITREAPNTIDKLKDRILHVHLSETDTFEHTNSILGTGKADFRAYVDKVLELGIEENCQKYGEVCVAGIEMGEPGGTVDDPERWVRESLDYLGKILPELKR
ncbi:sugar phosphate isomerase/epimerase family protein [Candidatus Poribacteria bacterium]